MTVTAGTLAISLTANTNQLNKGMEKAAKKIEGFARGTKRRLGMLTQSTSTTAKITRGFDAVVSRAGRALARYASSASAAVRKVNNFGRASKGASTIMKVWGAQMAWFIRSMGIIAAGRIIFGGLRAIEMFNRAMNQSLAIMGSVSDAMRNKMEAAAIDMARVTVFSSAEIAKGYFFLASAGLSAAQSLAALPIVARFAQAGMFDMSRATDLLTDAQSALGLTVKDTQQNMMNMRRMGDVLVKANTLVNATVEQLSQSLTTKFGAALRLLGKDAEEGLAVLGVFADQGVKAAEAGSGGAIVLRDLTTKAIKNAKAFKDMSIAVFDSSGEMRHLADIVEDLENAMRGQSDSQKKMTLLTLGFTDKSIAFTQALIGTSEKIRELDDALRAAGGTMSDVASKQMTPLQEAMADLNAGFLEATEKSGSALLFGISKRLENLGSLVEILAGTNEGGSGRVSKMLAAALEREKMLDAKLAAINKAKNNPLELTIKEIALNKKISASIQGRRDKIGALARSMRALITEAEAPWLEILGDTRKAISELGLDKFQIQLRALDKAFDVGLVGLEVFLEIGNAIRKQASAEKELAKAAEESLRIAALQKRMFENSRTPVERYDNAIKDLITDREHLDDLVFKRSAKQLIVDRARELSLMSKKDRLTFGFEVARSTNIKFLNKNRQEKQQVEDKKVIALLEKQLKRRTGIDVSQVTAPRGGTP